MTNWLFKSRLLDMFSWLGSLRTRLVLGNIAITFLAVAGMGFYVTYRAQQSNTYLTTQLNESVHNDIN